MALYYIKLAAHDGRRLRTGVAMRTKIRGARSAGALVLALTLVACGRQAAPASEEPQPISNAEREAGVAAEQLAALGGAANAAQRAAFEGDFQASGGVGPGGEGAWELVVFSDYAQFTRTGLDDGGGITSPREFRERGMRVVAGAVTITIQQQACDAGGVELPYTAHVLYEGVAYQGCARRGVQEGERQTWASFLPDLMPAIDACLARASARPARVTFAAAHDEATVAVRVREADGSRRECIASGGEASVYESLADMDRRPGEGDPEFVRGGGQPRPCAQAAVGRDGARLGWLIPRGC